MAKTDSTQSTPEEIQDSEFRQLLEQVKPENRLEILLSLIKAQNSTIGKGVNISVDKFDAATLRIEAAGAIIRALSIPLMNNNEAGELWEPSGQLLHDALCGASLLLEDATEALTAR